MIHYNVDTEKRVVTATITGCKMDAMNCLNKALRSEGYSAVSMECTFMPDTFTAKAKCHPDDSFDEQVGKDLAKKRLLDKYHEARVRAFNRADKMSDYCQLAADKAIQKSLAHFKK